MGFYEEMIRRIAAAADPSSASIEEIRIYANWVLFRAGNGRFQPKNGGVMKSFLWLLFALAVWFPSAVDAGSAQCSKYQVRLEGTSSIMPGFTYTETLEMHKVGEASGYNGQWQVDRLIQINTYAFTINPPLATTSRVDFGHGNWMICSAHCAGNVLTNECSGGQFYLDVSGNRIGSNRTGVWIGRIEGDTASLRFDAGNPASPAIVGEIRQPEKREMTLDIIPQDDQFVFDGNSPGVLEMEFEARVTPSEYEQQVQWIIPEIDGSTCVLDPASAQGGKIKVTYKGLPDDNGQFGLKTIQAVVSVGGCRAEDSRQVKVFYPRDARNNPDGRYPNWFYYWKQTPAAKPRGQLVNIEYGGSTYDQCADPACPAQFTPGAGHATIHVCDLSRLGPDFQNRFPVLSLQSPYHLGWEISRHIDTFAKAVIHEFVHWQCYHNFRYGKTIEQMKAADTDRDGLPDTAEPQFHFDPNAYQTHMATHAELKKIDGDEEWLAYTSMSEIPMGKYNPYDWGKPGSQWP